MTKPALPWMNSGLLGELAVTVATITVIGMLCTIGVEMIVIIGRCLGAP